MTNCRYEENLWSLSWEIYGSMILFMILTISAGFQSVWRSTLLVCAMSYYFKIGANLYCFLFCSGALLADLTLVMDLSRVVPRGIAPGWRATIREYSTTRLASFALYLATQPPEKYWHANYSRHLNEFFKKYLTPTGGMSLHY